MIGLSSIIKLNSFIGSILKGLFDLIFTPIIEAVTAIINSFVGSLLNWVIVLFYQFIIVPIASIIDALQMLFKILAGVSSPIYTNSSVQTDYFNLEGNLVLDLLFNEHVMSVLLKLAVLSLFLLVIFTFIAIIKAEYAYDGKTVPKSKIIGKSLKALFSFLFVPAIALIGVFASSFLLQSLDLATRDGNNSTISTQILIASAHSSNRVRTTQGYYENMLAGNLNTMGVIKVSGSSTSSSDTREMLATMIDNAFRQELVLDTSKSGKFDHNKRAGFGSGMNGYDILFFDFDSHFKDTGTFTFNAKDPYLMFYYYNLWQFNYILCIGALIVVAWIFLKIMLGLTKRLFEIMLLFLASPVAISMMPLDDGKALKNWKEKFIGRVCMVYAPVIIMNLFIFLLGWISNVDVLSTVLSALSGGQTVTMSSEQLTATIITTALISPQAALIIILAQNLLNILFIIAGAKIVEESSGWISKIFGIDGNLVAEGGAIGKSVVDKVKTGIALANGGMRLAAKMGNKGKGPKDGGGDDDGNNGGGNNGGAGDGPSNGVAAKNINENAKMSGKEVQNNNGNFINQRSGKLGIATGDFGDETKDMNSAKRDTTRTGRFFKSVGTGFKNAGMGVLRAGGAALKAVGSTPLGKIASAPVRAAAGVIGFGASVKKDGAKINQAGQDRVNQISNASLEKDTKAFNYKRDLNQLGYDYGVKSDDIQKMGNMYNDFINRGYKEAAAMQMTQNAMNGSMSKLDDEKQKELVQKASEKVNEAAKIKSDFESAVNEANAKFEEQKAKIKNKK